MRSSRLKPAALGLIFFLFALSLSERMLAQQIVVQGGITDVSDEIGRIVRLTWRDGILSVDREHWEKMTGEKTDEEKEDDRLAAMIKRGVPEEIAKRMMAARGPVGRIRGGYGMATATPLGELFEELKTAAGSQGGGYSGGGDEMNYRSRGADMMMDLWRNSRDDDFRISIREKKKPFQEILVEDHHVKGLRIEFRSTNRVLLFLHRSDGNVQVAHTSEQRNDAFSSINYDEMVRQQPLFFADMVSILEGVGIQIPYSRYDSRIVDAVSRILGKPEGSLELFPPEHEAYVREQGLLDDPKYLAIVLTQVSESSRTAIEKRLEELKVAK